MCDALQLAVACCCIDGNDLVVLLASVALLLHNNPLAVAGCCRPQQERKQGHYAGADAQGDTRASNSGEQWAAALFWGSGSRAGGGW